MNSLCRRFKMCRFCTCKIPVFKAYPKKREEGVLLCDFFRLLLLTRLSKSPLINSKKFEIH